MDHPLAAVLPLSAGFNPAGHLEIAGCDVVELAERHGTPLYVFDEATLRGACREWREAFESRYPRSRLLYAAKAFLNLALAEIVRQEGLGIDVASLGELSVAAEAGFAADSIYLHGNNKGRAELELASRLGIGAVVVDNADEVRLLAELGRPLRVVLRVNPNVDPHTHDYISTGTIDSKFGVPIQTGQAEDLVSVLAAAPALELVGLHFHLGSQLFDVRPYELAIAEVLDFAARMRDLHGLDMQVFSPGGGFGVRYAHEHPLPAAAFAEAIAVTLGASLKRHGFGLPTLIIEAGRSIVARAGLAVYTVGSVKRVPGVRTYVAVDGGMGDNIRPALYGAAYSALCANRAMEPPAEWVRVVGKYCESGDILLRRVKLPVPAVHDLIAVPMSGAYALPMASNYNLSMRPAVLLASGGEARLIRRREELEDLLRLERLE